MDREEIGSTIGLGLGLALLGIGFTMRGDLNFAVGTAFVVLGLLLVLLSGALLYRHERRKRGNPQAAERVQAGVAGSLSLHLPEAPSPRGAAPVLKKSRQQIAQEIASMPLGQQANAIKDYRGLHVEWEGKVNGIARHPDGRPTLFLNCAGSGFIADTWAVVAAGVPGVNLLHSGNRVKVTGTIWGTPPEYGGSAVVLVIDPADVVLLP